MKRFTYYSAAGLLILFLLLIIGQELRWEAYSHPYYKYSVRYPNYVTINVPSELMQNLNTFQKTDPIVVLLDKDSAVDKVSTISISVITETGAKGIIDLRKIFEDTVVPSLIQNNIVFSSSNITFQEIEFNDYPALKILYSDEEIIQILNDDNIISIAINRNIDPDTENSSPDKRLTTERILETIMLH